MAEKPKASKPSLIEKIFSRDKETESSVPNGLKVASEWSWRVLVIAAVLALIGFLVVQLRYVVIPVFVAILLGALLIPVVDFLERWRWPRWLGVTVTELGLIAGVTGLVFLVVTQVRGGMEDLTERTLKAIDDLKQLLTQDPINLSPEQIDKFLDDVSHLWDEDISSLLDGAMSVGTSVGHFLAGLLLAMFASIFILLDGRKIWAWVLKLLPSQARDAADGGAKAGWVALSNFTRVQILVAFIDAVGIGLGAAILGVPLAFPIAVLVFMGSFVPIIGAVVTGAVAVFIALVYNGWVVALIMLIVVLGVQQFEGHVLQPLIMGTAVKIHPLAIVLVVTGGTLIAGIPGALFGVPLVAFLNSATSYISSGKWRTNPNPTVEDIVASDPSE